MGESGLSNKSVRIMGAMMLLVGCSVFVIRFQHAGPYQPPSGGNLLGGMLALALGVILIRAWFDGRPMLKPIRWLALIASPVVLFFALYSTLAELEEVIVLKATNQAGQPANLRLWVVDREGAAWVTMPKSKSDQHGLMHAKLEMLRSGQLVCVISNRVDDRATINEIHMARHQKYSVQRMATTIGLFGREADMSTVTLRLDPCSDVDSDPSHPADLRGEHMNKNEEIIRDFVSAWNRLDPVELASFFAEDGIYHNMPTAPIEGRSKIEDFIRGFSASWTETSWDLLTIGSSGNVVFAERLDRTRAGEKSVDLPCVGVFEMENGKIKIWRDYFDFATYGNGMA